MIPKQELYVATGLSKGFTITTVLNRREVCEIDLPEPYCPSRHRLPDGDWETTKFRRGTTLESLREIVTKKLSDLERIFGPAPHEFVVILRRQIREEEFLIRAQEEGWSTAPPTVRERQKRVQGLEKVLAYVESTLANGEVPIREHTY